MIWVAAAFAGTLSGLVSANGHGAVVLEWDDSGYGVLSRFHDHLYKTPSPSAEDTRDLLYDSYFGLRAEGASGWLTPVHGVETEPGTGIVRVDRSVGSLVVTEHIFAPMSLGRPGFVHLLEVRNEGASEVAEVEVFSLHNYHLGDGEGQGNEQIVATAEGLAEWGSTTGLGMFMLPLSTPTATSCDDVWARVNAGGDYTPGCDSTGDDRVGGFQWSLGPIAPGETRWVGTVDAFSLDLEALATTVATWISGRDIESLVDAERADWAGWHGSDPSGLSGDESLVYQQSLAYLRMAQVRESGDPEGQIVASLPYADGAFTHVWNIAWARDGAYAARALAEAGHPEEAALALRFLAREGKMGAYADYIEGLDYTVSLCRYYGDGTEWSDDDGTGPNIELDDLGLYLWALHGAVEAGAELDGEIPRALTGAADVLAALVDETGLVTEDSSIWERHWNGNQKHFTYTSAWAARGLRDAADLADRIGDDRAETYRTAASGIESAIASQLVIDGVVLGNLEESSALDLAAVDAFNNGSLNPESADASLAAWEALRVTAGGYKRNDDGDTYDEQEWLFIDLRLAELHARRCEDHGLLDRATALALDNHGVLPELLDPATGEVTGPAPMIGFGAGAYVLALHARADATCDEPGDTGGDSDGAVDTGVPADTDDTGDNADSADSDDTGATDRPAVVPPDCGCAAGPGAWLMLLGWRGRRQSPVKLLRKSPPPAASRL